MSDALRILVLEDNRDFSQMLDEYLRAIPIPMEVHIAETREEFVRELQQFAPDLVLADYNLPDFTATQAIELTKKLYPYLPVIVITGMDDHRLTVEVVKAGAEELIAKTNLGRITQRIRQAGEKKRLEVALRTNQEALIKSVSEARSELAEMRDDMAEARADTKAVLRAVAGATDDPKDTGMKGAIQTLWAELVRINERLMAVENREKRALLFAALAMATVITWLIKQLTGWDVPRFW